MGDQLITKLKRVGYELDTSELALKCASLAERLDFTAGEFAEAFEAFAITR